MTVTYSISELKERIAQVGIDKAYRAIEREACKKLKEKYIGDWTKVNVLCDVNGDQLEYTIL